MRKRDSSFITLSTHYQSIRKGLRALRAENEYERKNEKCAGTVFQGHCPAAHVFIGCRYGADSRNSPDKRFDHSEDSIFTGSAVSAGGKADL